MAVDIGLGGPIYFGRTEAVFVGLALLILLGLVLQAIGARTAFRRHWLYEALFARSGRFTPPPEAAGQWGLTLLALALGAIFAHPLYKVGYFLLRWPGVVLVVAACALLYLWLFRTWSARPLRQVLLMSMAFAAILGVVVGTISGVSGSVSRCQSLAWTSVPGEREMALTAEGPGARLVLTQLHYSQPCDHGWKDAITHEQVVDMNFLAALENRGTSPIVVQRLEVTIGDAPPWRLQPTFWRSYRFPLLPPSGRVAFESRVMSGRLPVGSALALGLEDFAVTTRPVTESVTGGLTLVPVDVNGTLEWGEWGWTEDLFPSYTVRGHVRNDGANEACDFDAYVAVYGAQNELLGASAASILGTDGAQADKLLDCLAPGSTAKFQPLSFDTLAGMADHYEVWFQTRPTWYDDW